MPVPSRDSKKSIIADPQLSAAMAIGTRDDAAATTNTGSFSLIALIKRLLGKQDYGRNGSVVRIGTAVVNGNFVGFTAITDIVISAITSTGITGDSLIGATIPQGTTIYGNLTSITLTSGTVACVNA